ncbi:unnamed protein product [Sphenostylis stenocarpa]|uniref:Glutaredoxin domain-containing protein n=1 Tax=Sphenostylis stenocarpa TaxID=92480 RepID=A0AA86SWA1_9FABA|nr:unnamed protein product [Sphenostylis stenocarpa]
MEFMQMANDVIATLSFSLHRPLLPLTITTLLLTIPYRTCISTGARDLSHTGGMAESNGTDPANVATMVSENAVVIIGRRGCCMCHVVKRLLQGLGVNPPVYEVHEDHEAAVARHLSPTPTSSSFRRCSSPASSSEGWNESWPLISQLESDVAIMFGKCLLCGNGLVGRVVVRSRYTIA